MLLGRNASAKRRHPFPSIAFALRLWPSLSRWDEPGRGFKVPKNPPASGKLNGGFDGFNDEMLPPSSARAHSVLRVV